MIVKFMGYEDAPDDDSRKTHTLFANVERIYFERIEDADQDDPKALQAVAHILLSGEDLEIDFDVWGNVYVMNDTGKTISSFGPAPIPRPDTTMLPCGHAMFMECNCVNPVSSSHA